ncbi:unnamed protein product, partial [Iphiclides podalirius]
MTKCGHNENLFKIFTVVYKQHSKQLSTSFLDYGLHDYEESPQNSFTHDYNIHDAEYGPHGFGHQNPVQFHPDHQGNHHGQHHVGYHHKHYDHSLAAKTLLWPIAGIALLGAAAALVSNPILLQLGVVSGRRKRRDTEEVTGLDDVDVKKWYAALYDTQISEFFFKLYAVHTSLGSLATYCNPGGGALP